VEKEDHKIKNFSRFILYLLTLIIIILIFGFIANNQYNFILNAVCIYIAYVMIYYIEKRGIIKITRFVKSLLVLVIILHLAFGQYFNLYVTNSYFDKGLHLIGTFAISLFIYQVLVKLVEGQLRSRLFVFIFISSVGITSGVLLEILEFMLDLILNTDNQKSLNDTNLDIIFNIIGASLAGFTVVKTKE